MSRLRSQGKWQCQELRSWFVPPLVIPVALIILLAVYVVLKGPS